MLCLNGTGEYPDAKEVKFNFETEGLPVIKHHQDAPLWPYCYVGDFSRVRDAICTHLFETLNY